MTSLSENLLELLNILKVDTPTEKREVTEGIETAVTGNAVKLDSLSAQAASASSTTIRANLACAAIKLLFGSAVVIEPQDTAYTSTEQYSWYSRLISRSHIEIKTDKSTGIKSAGSPHRALSRSPTRFNWQLH